MFCAQAWISLICTILSKSILPYFELFSVLHENTDILSASSHLLVITIVVFMCTCTCLCQKLHVSPITCTCTVNGKCQAYNVLNLITIIMYANVVCIKYMDNQTLMLVGSINYCHILHVQQRINLIYTSRGDLIPRKIMSIYSPQNVDLHVQCGCKEIF